MEMKKIHATIERAGDGTFSVYMKDEMFSGMGDTIEAAKADMLDQIGFYVAGCKEDKQPYPEFLDKPYEIVYEIDTQSMLSYYAGVLTPAMLERLSGIPQRQISSYIRGTKPRAAQLKKIESGIHRLGKELISISLI